VQPFGLRVSSGACRGVSSQSLLHPRLRTSQPFGLNGKMEFCEAHNAPWAASAAAIGLTPASMTALTAATTNACPPTKAYNDHLL
jgi:hypothetical protein